ncbi:MAG: hypothetical protein R3C61_27280 [Bacteroidia bacterium]
MLGLILIYFIGKYFYELADDHNKSKWGFAILGVVSYYAGTIIGGSVIGIIYGLTGNMPDDTDTFLLGLLAIPVGLLTCVGLYFLLKKMWSKEEIQKEDLIDQIGAEE